MHIYRKKTYILTSLLLTLTVLFLTAFLFSCVFYLFPVKQEWLMTASDLSLTFSIFAGAFYLRANQIQFRAAALFVYVVVLTVLFLTVTVTFGNPDTAFIFRKILFIFIASFCGYLFGK